MALVRNQMHHAPGSKRRSAKQDAMLGGAGWELLVQQRVVLRGPSNHTARVMRRPDCDAACADHARQVTRRRRRARERLWRRIASNVPDHLCARVMLIDA
eukprot:347887-Alexandrium_andersonii.AAC.1